jgi:hypothetical protein
MKVCSGSNIYLHFDFFLHVVRILLSLSKSPLAPFCTVSTSLSKCFFVCWWYFKSLLLHLSVCQSIVAFTTIQITISVRNLVTLFSTILSSCPVIIKLLIFCFTISSTFAYRCSLFDFFSAIILLVVVLS